MSDERKCDRPGCGQDAARWMRCCERCRKDWRNAVDGGWWKSYQEWAATNPVGGRKADSECVRAGCVEKRMSGSYLLCYPCSKEWLEACRSDPSGMTDFEKWVEANPVGRGAIKAAIGAAGVCDCGAVKAQDGCARWCSTRGGE